MALAGVPVTTPENTPTACFHHRHGVPYMARRMLRVYARQSSPGNVEVEFSMIHSLPDEPARRAR